MERLHRILSLSFPASHSLASISEDTRLKELVEGTREEVKLVATPGSSDVEVSEASTYDDGSIIVTLRRKTLKQPLNTRRPLSDISINKHVVSTSTSTPSMVTMHALHSNMTSSASLSLQSVLKTNGYSTKQQSCSSRLQAIREREKVTLDNRERESLQAIVSNMGTLEKNLKLLDEYSSAESTATVDNNWLLALINEYVQNLTSLFETEDAQVDLKEVKSLNNCLINDIVNLCHKEVDVLIWWDNGSHVERVRIWLAVLEDFRTQIATCFKKAGKRESGKDTLLDNTVGFLNTLIDIFELLKDVKQLADTNKSVRDELKVLLTKLTDSNGKLATEVHNSILKSSSFQLLVNSKKQLLHTLTTSSGSWYSTFTMLMNSINVIKSHRSLIVTNENVVDDKIKSAIRELNNEFATKEYSNKNSTPVGGSKVSNWLANDNTVQHLQDLISIDRKFAFVDKFNNAFFETPKADVSKECVRARNSINKKCEELVTEWNEKATEVIVRMKSNKNERLLDLDIDAKVLTTNFSEGLIVMIHMLDSICELGFGNNVSEKVHQYLKEKKGLLKEGIQLRNISDFYNSLSSVDSIMIACHKPLLIDYIVGLEELIQNAPPNIENMPHELHLFMRKSTEIIQKFESENATLKRTHAEILSDFGELLEVDLVTGHEQWKKVVKKAVNKIQQLTKKKQPEYVMVWTNDLAWQLLKILSVQVKTNLLNVSSYIPRFECNVKIFNNRLVLYPSLPNIRLALFSQIDQLINFPRSLQFFENWNRMVESLPGECAKFMSFAYSQIDETLRNLEVKLSGLRRWIAIGCLNVSKLAGDPALNSGEVWRKIVDTIRTSRRELERQEDFVDAGCIRLKTATFKMQVDETLTNLLDGMLQHVDASMQKDKEIVEQFLNSLTSTMNYQPHSTEELREAWNMFDGVQEKMKGFLPNVRSLEDKVYLIKSIGRVQPKAEEVLDNWRTLDDRVKNFQNELRDKQEFMKTEIISKTLTLKSELEKFNAKWQSIRLSDKEQLNRRIAIDYAKALEGVETSWNELKAQIERAKRDLSHFNLNDKGNLDLFEELDQDIETEQAQWEIYKHFETSLKSLEDKKHVGAGKTIFEFQDLMIDWQDKLKNRKTRVENFLFKLVEEYQAAWPGLKLMVGESFQREHWNQLMQILGVKAQNPDSLTFGHIIERSNVILSKLDELKELAARAQGEVTIREAIQELDNWCATAEFELMEYTDTFKAKIPLIKEWAEMMSKVGDNQSLLQSIKDSKFFVRFKDRIVQFDKKLGGLDRYLTKINNVQRRWLYLEPIFNKGALPSEKPRFQKLNGQFIEIMRSIEKNKKIAYLSEMTGLEITLHEILEQIEVCQSALNKFLEETRNRFPRFFFLGDDDLLEILGQSENPTVIRLHLKKIFAGIFDVEFKTSGQNTTIQAMLSSVGESVELKAPIQVEGNLEAWLSKLEGAMFTTLEDSLTACIKEPQLSISKYPGQILGVAKEIDFSHRVMDAIEKNKLSDCKKHLEEILDTLTRSKDKLGKVDQSKVKSLIMDVIHQVSVVDELILHRVTDTKSWYWFKQLKYFISKKTKKCQVMMCRASFDYTYEYQGNPAKLVHTPLTDKCYLTLTQGMMMGFGGNPYGPAGTGKTESVKALGQCMARMVLVFNCDENLDYKSIGRIFIGLVKCGGWGCFDEFNRLIEEQLSAISQQIQIIQDAIREKKDKVELLGKVVEVNCNAGIFVTLNPAGKGYGGRSKLPDNLKLLFRPVAMSRPDNELIGEVLLYSEGFKQAKRLAKKIVNIFTLCNQLLSKQQHYDWGLRALKVILTTSGDLMQAARIKGDKTVLASPKLEDEILLKALNDNTASKLTSEDLNKFNALIEDVLPGVKIPDIKQEELVKAIETTLVKHSYQLQDRQLKKIVQFHSALNQRIGVVIMGPSGSGKTTIWSVLKEALQSMGITVKIYVMNPKAISRAQLLGWMDLNTREFHNGVLTAAARKVIKEPTNVLNWIICDGDVDPKWIEALNSVLDDNHLLTLPTGERIAFGSNVNFIFETHDLKFASPATVSRMGMIYLNNDDVDLTALLAKWKTEKAVKPDSQLDSLLKDYFEELVRLVFKYEDQQIVRTTQMGSILTLLTQVRGCDSKKKFAIGAMRGVVSNLPTDLRDEAIQKLSTVLGERLSFLTYFDDKQGAVVSFKPITAESNNRGEARDPCVLTSYVQAILQIVNKILETGATLILVGPEGGGKNTVLKKAIHQLSQGVKLKTVTIYCNSQTSSQQIISLLLDSCTRSTTSTGPILRPKDCTKLLVHLRDINLAKPDEYASIELISFLQQAHAHRGFYDEELEFTQLDRNIQFVVTMNPSSDVGRHEISTRLTAATQVVFVDYPTKEDMKIVVHDMVESTFGRGSKNLAAIVKSKASIVDGVTGYLLDIFAFVKSTFFPESQRHYTFTPKDIGAILDSCLTYDVETAEDLCYAVLQETALVFKARLVKPDELSKFDSANRKYAQQHLPSSGLRDAVFTAMVKKDPTLTKITQSGYTDLLTRGLVSYQRENIEIDLCLTDQLIELIQTLDRIVSRPGGKAILMGSSGSARKLATHYVCHMLNVEFETFSPGKNYSLKEFRKETRRMLELAGFQGKKVCMYLESHHVLNPSFMEDINSLLSSNQIPGLFRPEEVESALKEQVDSLRDEFFGESIFDCFLLRIKQNFKAVFSLDPLESNFGKYLTDNPALMKKCRLVWVQSPTSESLRKIATSSLKDFFVGKTGTDLDQGLVENMVEIHRQLGKEPRSFFAYQDLFKKLLAETIDRLKARSSHLTSGVEQIKGANKLVDALSEGAGVQKRELKIKQDEAEKFLQKIQQTYESASDQKREAEEIKEFLKREEEKTLDKRETIKVELDKVQPIVDAAIKQVGSISKSHISELKSFANPPPQVDDVFQALFKLNGEGSVSWAYMKKTLGNDSFFKGILNIDARKIPTKIRKEVADFVNKNPGSFEKAAIYRVSQAAGPVADYIKALLQLGETYDKIKPYEDQLRDVDSKLASSKDRLSNTERELSKIDEKVAELKVTFGKTTSEAELLKFELQKAEDKINKASVLLEKLSGENSRWMKSLEDIKQGMKEVPAQSLMAAAFITYLSDKDEGVRAAKINSWCQMFQLKRFNFVDFLSDESSVLEFVSEGLSPDQLTIENALVSLNSFKSPLVVDPNNTLTQWLLQRLKRDKQIEIVGSGEKKIVSVLELGIRFGKTIVITDVDEIDSLYFNILRRDLKKQGPRLIVSIGEKVVDWSDGFKLVFTSRNSSIKLEPTASALVTIVNNLVTTKGLEEKLLGIIINDQKPQIEAKKKECLEQERLLKLEISKLEKKLLEELATASGNILDNAVLLASLEETKTKSIQIAISLQDSSKLKESLEKERSVYQAHATTGTILFLLVRDSQHMNNMYAFSLTEFSKVFKQNLQATKSSGDVKEFIKLLDQNLYKGTFLRFGLALQKKDKLAFALHLISKQTGTFQENELDFLLDRSEVAESKLSLPSWANEESLPLMNKFNALFPQIVKGLKFEKEEWRQWFTTLECEKAFPPSVMLRPVQRVMLVKIFRGDRLMSSLEDFACQCIGLTSLNELLSGVSTAYAIEPSPEVPVLFVTSVGSDPSKEIEEFAEANVTKERFVQMSMGGGQNEAALKSLESCAANGEWLCLKNLHLVPNFLPELEKALNRLELNKSFKLFLTTEEHPKFPQVLLESCFKLSYEAPPGLRRNVERVYSTLSSGQLKQMSAEEARITYILALFHAMLQERRTYIPQGWSKFYEFSLSDFKSGLLVLETIMTDRKIVDWPGLYGLFENAIYGGRIDTLVDLDVLRAYLETMFNERTLKSGQLKVGPTAPQTNELKDHMKAISQLPEDNKPSLFGLPDVFQNSVQRAAVATTINSLKTLSALSRDGEEQGNEFSKILALATPYVQLWRKYYSKLTAIPEISKPFETLSDDIVEAAVQQEINQRIKVMQRVNNYFNELEKIADGRSSLTSQVERFAKSLALNQLPSVMSEIWDGSDYPDEWIRLVGRKTGLLKNWAVALAGKTLYSSKLPLGVFFEPDILLNTLRQKTCRQLKKPLDELEMLATFGNETTVTDSAYSFLIGDLQLEGGKMTRGSVEISNNVAERESVEMVSLGFVEKGKGTVGDTVELPVYLTSNKESMLMRLKVPYIGDKNEIILAGCSLFV